MRSVIALFILLAAAAPVTAQSAGKIAVGASIGTRAAPSSAVGGDPFGIGLLWRLGHSKEGFGWDWGLNWFSSDVDQSAGSGSSFELGELHIRPVMAGYGYTHLMGRYAIKAGIQGGYAFTSLEMDPSALIAYHERTGVTSLSTDARNTLVAKPQISLWRDISRKVGVNMSAGYMIARPTITVSTTLGNEQKRVRADMFTLKMGVVYSVF